MEQETGRKGLFVALEGGDEAYVNSLFDVLKIRLEGAGADVLAIKFPNLHKSSGYFVEQYLKGQYTKSHEVGPYAATMFSALDRYDSAEQISRFLDKGGVVLATGFNGSTMAKQGRTFTRPEERRGYFIWDDALEYEMLGIPRPDKTLVLETSRGSKPEKSRLPTLETVYSDIYRLFTKDFQVVDCTRNKRPLDAVLAADIVWIALQPLLPPNLAAPQAVLTESDADINKSQLILSPSEWEIFKPAELSGDILDMYTQTMERIRAINNDLVRQLVEYLEIRSKLPQVKRDSNWREALIDNAYRIVIGTRPVASFGLLETYTTSSPPARGLNLQTIADSYLSSGHGQDEQTRLVAAWPRNELDMVVNILYEYSGLSMAELESETSKWSFDQKETVLQSYLSSGQNAANTRSSSLELVKYEFDTLSELSNFLEFSEAGRAIRPRRQQLTPRYGYDMPKAIEEAGLAELYEECFDLSFGLHSELQAAIGNDIAQCATLLGHKIRFTIALSPSQASFLLSMRSDAPGFETLNALLADMKQLIAEKHPIIGEAL